MLVPESKPTLCSVHKYDKVDMLDIVIRPNQSGYHPKERDSVMVYLCPAE